MYDAPPSLMQKFLSISLSTKELLKGTGDELRYRRFTIFALCRFVNYA
ncbi:MAG: hypothetical protein ACP5NC_07420 [Nitrososphaeria archaeon]